MMYMELPIDEYPSIYKDDDFISKISSVEESVGFCNGPPYTPDWLGFLY